MRIIKYIFLLIVLAMIAVSVYVATQKGEFSITTSIVLDVPRPIVFNYLNDYKNWEDWSAWKKADPGMTYKYGENTVGKGGTYSWSGTEGEGTMTTVFVKENDSIAQKVSFSGTTSTAYITLKDTLGKTKITWNSKGRVSFIAKVHATFNGGVDRMVRTTYEKSLYNLKTLLLREIKTYNILVNGITQRPGTFYLKQTIRCKSSDVQSRILYFLPKMIKFIAKNKIPSKGSPFVIYESSDPLSGLVTFSIGAPLSEEVFLGPGSDMAVRKLEPYTALKVTLTGDYSHRSEAQGKAAAYMTANNMTENTAMKKLEVYVKSASDVKSPSKWVTEFIIPLKTSAPAAAPPAAVRMPAAAPVPAPVVPVTE